MTEKNKELGREELIIWLEEVFSATSTCGWGRDVDIQAFEQIKALIQQSGEKPEIDKKFIEKWRGILEENGDIEYYEGVPNVVLDDEDLKKMLIEAQLIQRKPEITDDLLDDIIDAVLEHADCHHTVDHDEDGIHPNKEYSITSEMIVKEKLRKILTVEKPKDFPKIICLCGSTRFMDAFFEQGWTETLNGKIVLSVGVCKHADDHGGEALGPEVVKLLDELHLRKIDLADEVLILNVGGYIGESTQNELDYARKKRKIIRFLEVEENTWRLKNGVDS